MPEFYLEINQFSIQFKNIHFFLNNQISSY